jgi:DUF1365 family protein
MPRPLSSAARQLADEESMALPLDLIAQLAESLAEFMIADYEREDWQDSPLIETLARIAAFLEAQGCEVPITILDVLRTASEAGRPVAVA